MNSRARVLSVAIGAFAVVLVTPIASSATFPGDNGRIIFSRVSFEGPTFIASMEQMDPTSSGSPDQRVPSARAGIRTGAGSSTRAPTTPARSICSCATQTGATRPG